MVTRRSHRQERSFGTRSKSNYFTFFRIFGMTLQSYTAASLNSFLLSLPRTSNVFCWFCNKSEDILSTHLSAVEGGTSTYPRGGKSYFDEGEVVIQQLDSLFLRNI